MEFTVVGLGELLWDMFPQGKQLGGAPANFAYHCQQQGMRGVPISCVGDDALGREILAEMQKKHLDVSFIAIDPDHPTGTVSVEVDDDGKPDYVIHEAVAWDHIPTTDEMMALARQADAICYGSLAQRSAVSRTMARSFLDAARPDCLKIFDVNLRQHYYSRELIETLLEQSTVLKLSDEELPKLAAMTGLGGSEEVFLDRVSARYSLDLVALTKGSAGSCLYQRGRLSVHPGVSVKVADTVGAGDSFTAVLAGGLLLQRDLDEINELANQTAAYVCSQSGAMPKWNGHLRDALSSKGCP